MFKSQKNVFWEALLVTIFIFGIGIFIGVVLENWRTAKISDLYQQSEIDFLDIKLQNEIYFGGNFNCEFAVNENMKFADRIYEEAKLLEKYENARRLTESLIVQHKKYDILRAMLFLNSVKLREKCGDFYDEIVYFYLPDYDNSRLDIKAKQQAFSRILEEIKQKKGESVLLIPIAANKDVSSINMILDMYNISKNELPIILINEKIKIIDLNDIKDIEQYLK